MGMKSHLLISFSLIAQCFSQTPFSLAVPSCAPAASKHLKRVVIIITGQMQIQRGNIKLIPFI